MMSEDDKEFHEKYLDRLRQEHEVAPNGPTLLLAVRHCIYWGLGLDTPDWVRDAFLGAFDSVLNAECGSWDEAFGRPYPKGTHLERVRENKRLAHLIEIEIINLCRNHKFGRSPEPVRFDDGLFERVGAKFGIGKTLCKELWYGR